MSTTNLTLSVPEPIKIENCEYEIEKIEREKNMKMETGNLVRERDLLKKEINFLEKTQNYTELEKRSLEEKLERRHEELDKRILQMEEKIKKFRQKKLNLNEKLDRSRRKCEELQHRNVETTQANDELRVKKMESDKAAQLYRSRLDDLELRMLKVEAAQAKTLNVNHANFVGAMDKSAAEDENLNMPDSVENGKVKAEAGNGDAMPPQVCVISDVDSGPSEGIRLSKKGGRNMAYSGIKEDGANVVFPYPGSRPADISAVAESKGSVQGHESKRFEVRGASYLGFRCECNLKIIDVIKTNLHKENLEIFEQMCFGNLLKINVLKFQGQLLKLLLLNMDTIASKKGKLVFKINNTNMEFGPREFVLITGLRFGKLEATRASSSIHKDVFLGRPRIVLKDVKEALLNVSRDHEGRGELTLKLALIYFLYGILFALDYKKHIDVQYLHLVDDLLKFDAFPWGRVAYDFLVLVILSAQPCMGGPKVTMLRMQGFSFALQVWAYEVMPSLARYCAARENKFENLTTWILHWSATKRIHFNDLKIFFALGDEVLQTAQASPEQQNIKVEQQEPSASRDSIPQEERRSLGEDVLGSSLKKSGHPIPDTNYDDLPRNESPEVEDEEAVKKPTPTRHKTFDPNTVSTNKLQSLAETERTRALFALAFDNPALDMPHLLWKTCSEFEISEAEYERSKTIYEMLLERTKRLKLWISYAQFEAFAMIKVVDLADKRKCVERARDVFERGLSYFRRNERGKGNAFGRVVGHGKQVW
ncbi:uncharacterized protein LOC131024694 [Salvia miltiorrhiza]|uniref:uncharacterized protein LOC131024694 n=1 Tax=Salvia miltiorrhiza TaxID=226208 RepID=UPI0025AC8DE2|nr:uncharacterized protein LOC131024694 [Salvia miltiorrhiza]